jgi:hypothetical protein
MHTMTPTNSLRLYQRQNSGTPVLQQAHRCETIRDSWIEWIDVPLISETDKEVKDRRAREAGK